MLNKGTTGIRLSEIQEEVFHDPHDSACSNSTGKMRLHQDTPEVFPMEGVTVRIQYYNLMKFFISEDIYVFYQKKFNSKTMRALLHHQLSRQLGQDSPSSTITVFSTSIVLHWKSAS